MDFKSLLSQLDQLNEATEKTKTGVKHTAEPGGYGRKDDEDEEGNKVKDTSAEKKGRGRPKKATQTSGEDKKYDFSAFGATGKDVKLPKWDKKKTTKHSLKEYFDAIDQEMIAEAEQIQIKPASQMPKLPGQTSLQKPGQPQQVAGQPPKNTQVIAQGNKTLGTVDNPQLAQQIKQSIGKGEMTLMPGEEMAEDGSYSAKAARAGKDIGKPGKAFGKIAKSAGERYGSKAAGERVAGAVLAKLRSKVKEADMPPNDSNLSPIGEAKKPDANKNGIPDYAEDGKGKNDLKKKKEKIDEGIMDKLKGLLVPKLIKLLGPDAEKIASAVKQVTGGNLTPSKENAMKVVQALGLDKAAAQGQSQQMTEGIAGNWQGKLIQALYSLGLLGSAGAAASMFGTIAGGNMAVIGFLLLMFANTFFGEAPGQVGAYGKFGNKGTTAQNGLDDDGTPIKNTNLDESSKKKKVKEGMEHRLKAARHRGKAHALAKESYNCKYDDMEEARHYHEGFKEGLDECYGQMPIQGYVGETTPAATVPGMASQAMPAMEADMDEGNAFTGKLKSTPQGSKFTLGGKTFKDTSNIEESPFAFESLDKQLNALLEGEEVTEGMTVSISKGQQGMPDSVSVNAQDAEADQLLSIIKQAGLGLFGGDDAGHPQATPPMTVDVDGGEGPQADIEVVDDHDDMLSLIRKMTGQGPAQSSGDYEEEGGEAPAEEAPCETCGESSCGCGSEEAVEEDETLDQREYEVAEDAAQDDEEAETAADENAEAAEDQALATVDAAQDENQVSEGGDGGEAGTDAIAADDAADAVNAEEEDLDESYANSDDDQFETDIDFMTKVISGGLNKQKSTGQTTQPVIAGQKDRMGYSTNESVNDWKKLAGIK